MGLGGECVSEHTIILARVRLKSSISIRFDQDLSREA